MYKKVSVLCAVFLLFQCFQLLSAQGPQIPNIFLNNKTEFKCSANPIVVVKVDQRNGSFTISGAGHCAPPDYPTQAQQIVVTINMNDSLITSFTCTTIEALSSTGLITPIAYVMGRCNTNDPQYKGCHFWMQLTNNNDNSNPQINQTPNIISILVLDGTGKRLAYCTGPVVSGYLTVTPTPN
jgi:hypothetical protein